MLQVYRAIGVFLEVTLLFIHRTHQHVYKTQCTFAGNDMDDRDNMIVYGFMTQLLLSFVILFLIVGFSEKSSTVVS